MQKISVHLIRMAVTIAAICAVVGAAEFGSVHHGGSFVVAKTRFGRPFK